MHNMLWVLLIYALIIVILLMVYIITLNKRKEEKEKSHPIIHLSEHEHAGPEANNEDAVVQTNNNVENPTVTAEIEDITDTEESVIDESTIDGSINDEAAEDY